MGAPRDRSKYWLKAQAQGKSSTKVSNSSPRIISWFPVTQKQRDDFIILTIKGGWIGIGCLIVFWIVVRFVGPAFGWWVPADMP